MTHAALSYFFISIHSLFTEGDHPPIPPLSLTLYFNPLPLYRGRHGSVFYRDSRWDFNPLPLYRGRQSLITVYMGLDEFQSTPSLQRETCLTECDFFGIIISIHSLFTEGDLQYQRYILHPSTFQSTPSLQRETYVSVNRVWTYHYFNPLPLYRGRPQK